MKSIWTWWRRWKGQGRRPAGPLPPWTLGAVSMADRESSTQRRSEFFGMNSPSGEDCYPAPSAEDDYFDTLGTSANPYRDRNDVGRRRR